MTPTSIPWYDTEDDFAAILGMLPVNESSGAMSYSEWVASIKRHETNLSSQGLLTMRIVVKPAAVKEWCEAHGVSVCRKSIANYAMLKMANPIVQRGSN